MKPPKMSPVKSPALTWRDAKNRPKITPLLQVSLNFNSGDSVLLYFPCGFPLVAPFYLLGSPFSLNLPSRFAVSLHSLPSRDSSTRAESQVMPG